MIKIYYLLFKIEFILTKDNISGRLCNEDETNCFIKHKTVNHLFLLPLCQVITACCT